MLGAGLQSQLRHGLLLGTDGDADDALDLVDRVGLEPASRQLSQPLAPLHEDQPLHEIGMRPELAVESPDESQALGVVLGGEVPRGPGLELARPAIDPEVDVALLQGLQDVEVVRGDEFHFGAGME